MRRARRKRVLMTATVVSAECVQAARIKDLTSTGAGIACNTPLQPGTDVVMRRGDLFIAARVAWTVGAQAGLQFYRPLPETDAWQAAATDLNSLSGSAAAPPSEE